MTAQFPNGLINECEEADFSELDLYSVLIGDIKNRKDIKPYSFLQKANPEKLNVFTACWDGYIPQYKITKERELLLIGFKYPALLPDYIEPDEAYELAKGDFWLGFRPDFYGGFVYVPFKNGKLITNKAEWVIKNGSYKNTHVTHYKNSNTENLLSKIKKIFKS